MIRILLGQPCWILTNYMSSPKFPAGQPDENHDFIKLYNGNANCNDEIEIHDESPYPNDDTFCTLQTRVAQTIGNGKKSIIYTFFKLSQQQCQLGFIKSANL